MNNQTIVWIHGDNLSPYNPALRAAPDAPAIFVWDDELLDSWQISLKRIVFIYECLLELPVTIRRGDVATQVTAFAQQHSANRILTADSPSPRHSTICQSIQAQMPSGSIIQIMDEDSFISPPPEVDMRRFSRFWRKIKASVLYPSR